MAIAGKLAHIRNALRYANICARIHKDKYNDDDDDEAGRRKARSKDQEKDEKKARARSKSRTRSIFMRKRAVS